MPFAPGYTRTKTFAAGGTLLPGDLNSIQDDLGGQIEKYAPEDMPNVLPTVGVIDGQIARYQNTDMAAQGIAWTFRYRAASASGYKWEFVGGSEMEHQIAAQENDGANNIWQSLTTDGPLLTVPLTGEYRVEWGACCQVVPNTGWIARLGLAINGVDPGVGSGDLNTIVVAGPSTGGAVTIAHSMHRTRSVGPLTAGWQLKLRYNITNAATNYDARYLRLRPVRVI